ncbi:MAG: peptide deformylase, partial [Coriobacteriia bacterium]|nr:peptide deformylase [Coriobacteriia bacterium]
MNIKQAFAKIKPARNYEVLTHPDPILSQKSTEIDFASVEDRTELDQLVPALIDTMRKEKGAGLAAIQVGIPRRVFVYDDEGKSATGASVLVNPRITYRSDESIEDEEGCLSFPALYASVGRSEKVIVEGYNLTGAAVTVEAEGFLARVFQHEIDHLDGVTFVDRLDEDGKKLALREYFDLR